MRSRTTWRVSASKFNINLLRHRDIKRRGKPFEVLTTLLDLFRDSQYGDMEPSEWDLDEREAKEVATAIRKMLLGELEGAMVPKAELARASKITAPRCGLSS